MKHLLSLERLDVGRTLALTVGSPSAHRRGAMLKHIAFMLLFLFAGFGQAWGETKTFSYGKITAHAALTTQTDSPVTLTWEPNGNTNNSPQHNKNGYAQLYASNKVTASIASNYEITGVTFTFSTAKTMTVNTNAPNYSYSSYTFTPQNAQSQASSCSWVSFVNSETAQAKITSIAVTYTASGSQEPTLSLDHS